MNKFGKSEMETLRAEINAAIAAVGAKHGVDLILGNGRYSDDHASFKLEMGISGAKPTTEKDLEGAVRFLENCMNISIDLDKVITEGRKKFKLTGYNRRARKNKYIVTDIVGKKNYVISEDTMMRWFKES